MGRRWCCRISPPEPIDGRIKLPVKFYPYALNFTPPTKIFPFYRTSLQRVDRSIHRPSNVPPGYFFCLKRPRLYSTSTSREIQPAVTACGQQSLRLSAAHRHRCTRLQSSPRPARRPINHSTTTKASKFVVPPRFLPHLSFDVDIHSRLKGYSDQIHVTTAAAYVIVGARITILSKFLYCDTCRSPQNIYP